MLRNTSIALAIALLLAGAHANTAIAQADEMPADTDGAKGLFFEQLSKPTQPINTGLRYWIQLIRNGNTRRATSRETFREGDHIQFHVCPNIDGYAYIVLKTVGTGEQAVLFPQAGESNKVEHGRDYTLPAGSACFTFDKNPGTEKLTVLLSRNKIDPLSFFAKPTTQAIQIASARAGSKDLIPAQVLVVDADTGSSSAPPVVAKAPPVATVTAPHVTKPAHNKVAERHATSPKSSPPQAAAPKSSAPQAARNDEAAVTTVVRTVPSGVLFVDVALDHE